MTDTSQPTANDLSQPINSQFKPVHNWPEIYQQYVRSIQAGNHTDKAFFGGLGIPKGTYCGKAIQFRAKLSGLNSVQVKRPRANQSAEIAEPTKNAELITAQEQLKGLLSASVSTFGRAASGDKVDTQALKAATVILQQHGLLEKEQQAQTKSQYEDIDTAQLLERVRYQARQLTQQ